MRSSAVIIYRRRNISVIPHQDYRICDALPPDFQNRFAHRRIPSRLETGIAAVDRRIMERAHAKSNRLNDTHGLYGSLRDAGRHRSTKRFGARSRRLFDDAKLGTAVGRSLVLPYRWRQTAALLVSRSGRPEGSLRGTRIAPGSKIGGTAANKDRRRPADGIRTG